MGQTHIYCWWFYYCFMWVDFILVFGTQLGAAIRATGFNQQMIRAQVWIQILLLF